MGDNTALLKNSSVCTTHVEAEQRIERFAREVLPRLREVAPVTVG